MITSTIDEARSQLAELIIAAERGEEVVISRAGKPIARLLPYQGQDHPRQEGQWRGRVRIGQDFDQLPPDIAEALGLDESPA
ncbi:MAG: type II toxin-antitoxin system prevent-host-death family antitoxin [Planctomycetia bacterium]|nr:type II toxin-antitoxin system prevent-host-death family antitoxin [Planctomycetia bacterium]